MKKIFTLVYLCVGLAQSVSLAQAPGGTLLDPALYARVPKADLFLSIPGESPEFLSLLDKAFKLDTCFPRGQGALLVCNGCAAVNALAIQRVLKFKYIGCGNRKPQVFSQCFLFTQCQKVNAKNEIIGAYIPDILNTLRSQGVCLQKDWSDSINCRDCGNLPTSAQKEKAQTYAIASYAALISLDSFARGKPRLSYKELQLAFLNYKKSWLIQRLNDDQPVVAVLSVTATTGHAVAVTGYDNLEQKIEYLDSNGGESCCGGGRKTMSYKEFFDRLVEAYFMTLKFLDCTD